MNIEPFGYAQGELLLLLDSIIKHWKIGSFDSEILIQNNADYPQNYVF